MGVKEGTEAVRGRKNPSGRSSPFFLSRQSHAKFPKPTLTFQSSCLSSNCDDRLWPPGSAGILLSVLFFFIYLFV